MSRISFCYYQAIFAIISVISKSRELRLDDLFKAQSSHFQLYTSIGQISSAKLGVLRFVNYVISIPSFSLYFSFSLSSQFSRRLSVITIVASAASFPAAVHSRIYDSYETYRGLSRLRKRVFCKI